MTIKTVVECDTCGEQVEIAGDFATEQDLHLSGLHQWISKPGDKHYCPMCKDDVEVRDV